MLELILLYGGFVAGFVFLIKGADWLVSGASVLAKRLRISDIVIGLTVVSFGTSAPELFVNIVASFRGNADLAVGNIVGSNIANIFLILGIAAVIRPLKVESNTVWKEVPLSFLAVLLVLVMANDVWFDDMSANLLTRSDGLVLIAFFVIFMFYTAGLAASGHGLPVGDVDEFVGEPLPLSKAILWTIAGIVALPIGGELIVRGASAIAIGFGMSEAMVGLSIVAIGTSLPEVAASGVAAFRGKTDIAVGNAVGSNIFNVFWVLGLSATIKPIPYNVAVNVDLMVAILASFLLFVALHLGRKHRVDRYEGVIFLLAYGVYLTFLVVRG